MYMGREDFLEHLCPFALPVDKKNLEHRYSFINHHRTTSNANPSNHIYERWCHPPSTDPRIVQILGLVTHCQMSNVKCQMSNVKCQRAIHGKCEIPWDLSRYLKLSSNLCTRTNNCVHSDCVYWASIVYFFSVFFILVKNVSFVWTHMVKCLVWMSECEV